MSACWKCGSPLTAGVAAAQAPGYTPSPVSGGFAAQPASRAGHAAQAPAADAFAYHAASAATGLGDMARSNRAAFWLGMLFPYFGFPIGLAFMMCDDRRRQEVGRLCILWSCLSGAIHLLLMFVSLLGMRELLVGLLGAVKGGATRGLPGGLGGEGGM